MNDCQELDGTVLRIYVVLANSNKPLGPREITRIVNLSSPSVAYRNLQKLEELELIEKNAFGEYTVKQRQRVKGHFWVAGRLFPRQLFYAFFFIGIMSVEAVIAATRLINRSQFAYDFILLIVVTTAAMVLFLLEGIMLTVFSYKKQP